MSTDRGHTRGRRALALGAGLAAVAALAGTAACGGDGEDEPSTSPTTSSDQTTTTPSTTAPVSPEEEAKAVYLEFVDVVERLASTQPDPNDSDLLRLAVDPVLGAVQDSLSTMQAENHRAQIGDRTSHDVLSVSVERADSASVRDCNVANDTTTDLDDGSVVDSGLSTRLIEATLTSNGQTWVVSDVATIEVLEGDVACTG